MRRDARRPERVGRPAGSKCRRVCMAQPVSRAGIQWLPSAESASIYGRVLEDDRFYASQRQAEVIDGDNGVAGLITPWNSDAAHCRQKLPLAGSRPGARPSSSRARDEREPDAGVTEARMRQRGLPAGVSPSSPSGGEVSAPRSQGHPIVASKTSPSPVRSSRQGNPARWRGDERGSRSNPEASLPTVIWTAAQLAQAIRWPSGGLMTADRPVSPAHESWCHGDGSRGEELRRRAGRRGPNLVIREIPKTNGRPDGQPKQWIAFNVISVSVSTRAPAACRGGGGGGAGPGEG